MVTTSGEEATCGFSHDLNSSDRAELIYPP